MSRNTGALTPPTPSVASNATLFQSDTNSDSSAANATLRSSCNVCAASKVRCTKEKPVCSRCSKKSLPCVYSKPRRAGRPAAKKPQNTSDPQEATKKATSSHKDTTGWYDQRATRKRHDSALGGNGDGVLPSSGLTPITSNGGSSLHSNEQTSPLSFSLPDLQPFSSVDSQMGAPNIDLSGLDDMFGDSGHNVDLDNYFLNDVDISQCGPFHIPDGPFAHSKAPSVRPDNTNNDVHASQPSFDMLLREFESMQSAQMEGCEPTTSGSDVSTRPPTPSVSSGCSCHSLAMSLMSKPTVGSRGKPQGLPSSFESVMELNSSLTDTVRTILQCSCRKDVYTLVVLTMAMFKALEWFDAAACLRSNDFIALPNAGIDGQTLKGQDPDRMAAQIVLSRLPGVQRLGRSLAEQMHNLSVSGDSSASSSKAGSLMSSRSGTPTVDSSFSQVLPGKLAESLETTLGTGTTKLARRLAVQVR